VTKDELLEVLRNLDVEYTIADHQGNLVKINFWIDEEDEDDE